jgi:hypothetical protein
MRPYVELTLVKTSGNDSKQLQSFKTEGLSVLKLMRNGGVPNFPGWI